MGFYAHYLNSLTDFEQITKERKEMLNKISSIRKRDILVFAADLSKNIPNVSTQIDYTDILPVRDQLSNLSGNEIDIILETPGGFAEVVEDIVEYIRSRYERVGMIIPGWAKSAGTIFAMAGDEILMGDTSGLGPIDAQIIGNGKRFSADAFLEGLKKIKEEVEQTKRLNPAYIPMLQNISPGEIEHCNNAQNFSKELVTRWLANYKFKYWDKHSSGEPVTQEERNTRAKDIAAALCSQSRWKTHGRSIKIQDLEDLRVKITDLRKDPYLHEIIMRYHTLLRMSFEGTHIYKMFETPTSQIYRYAIPAQESIQVPTKDAKKAIASIECRHCNSKFKIQVSFEKDMAIEAGAIPFPVGTNMFKCPKCATEHNLQAMRLQIEAQTGKRMV